MWHDGEGHHGVGRQDRVTHAGDPREGKRTAISPSMMTASPIWTIASRLAWRSVLSVLRWISIRMPGSTARAISRSSGEVASASSALKTVRISGAASVTIVTIGTTMSTVRRSALRTLRASSAGWNDPSTVSETAMLAASRPIMQPSVWVTEK
ncbi:hypothetical protein [Nonomuraea recticatena]|uniref:hypothetical protein n=1 Tax=Nonomuraea recticatena TaxID=46178 RepID=UPI00360DF5E8